jgi:hypothetical protein
LTSGGYSYEETIQAAKAHLEKLWGNAERHKQMKEAGGRNTLRKEKERGSGQADGHFTALCGEGLMEDLPNSFDDSDDFAAAVGSLDIHDYLQRDAEAHVSFVEE